MSRSDRELLEMAAKAANANGMHIVQNEVEFVDCSSDDEWNPLEDDGDALRLAVKLHMQVSITTESCRAETLPVLGVRVNDKDEMAATRRAIVKAAAAIGETLP